MKELSLIEKAFFLKNTTLFNDLDLDLLIAIADKMHQDIYEKDEKVFEVNQIANRMYFIVKGSIRILDENLKIIKLLQSNDFFGDESLFNEKPRTYNVSCFEDTLFLSINKTNLLNIISECPSVAISLLNTYSHNMKHRH
ncbi:MAG: cyclic nucleotide-binding domain-containing protein [Parachlamydiales bacterium]|jgi:CRP-like cAMP-binding protein